MQVSDQTNAFQIIVDHSGKQESLKEDPSRPEQFLHTASLDSRLSHSRSRFSQMEHIGFLKCGLTDDDKRCLAMFIQEVIEKAPRESNKYFSRSTYSLQLPRSLLYISAAKATYILLKTHNNSILKASGSSKKVTCAIQIPNDTSCNPTLVAQAVNVSLTALMNMKFVELKIYRQFSGNKGIWPLIGHADYYSVKHKQPKITLFNSIGTSAGKLTEKKIVISLNEHVEIADHIASAIHLLHTAGYLHGDLKPENALFSCNPHIAAGLIDFGFAFKPSEIVGDLPHPLEEGYYGSVLYTAPELYGDKNFKGDLFKVEIWAFGCFLYSLLLGRPPWVNCFPQEWKHEELEREVTSQQKIVAIDSIKMFTECDRKRHAENKQRSAGEEYLLLIYDILRLDPALRLDSLAITQRIAELKDKLLTKQFNSLYI